MTSNATGRSKTIVRKLAVCRPWSIACRIIIEYDLPPTIELVGQAWNYDPVNNWYIISANQILQPGYRIGCVATGPLPIAMIDGVCNNVVRVPVNTPVGDTTNGGLLAAPGLPIGQHEITYVVRDACGNVTEATLTVINVMDNIAPVAICDEITDVTLSSDGLAIVAASNLDDGSYDNCCLDYFEARRMDGDCEGNYDEFDPTVEFCCGDADSSITVVFRAYDCYGNFNDCMVTVNVKDKTPPIVLSCPAAVTITCDDYLNNLAAALANEDYSVLDQYGAPTFFDNCQYEEEYTVTQNLDNCSKGTITRSWKATDGTNSPVTCTQTIFVNHISDWVVEFPANVTVECTDGQLPDTGEPAIFHDECELIAVSYEDQTFTVVPDACYKIERVWTVINWCVYEDFGSNLYTEAGHSEQDLNADWDGDGDKDNRTFRDGYNSSGNPGVADGYISFKQIIKVVDNEAPVFTIPPIDGCITDTDCDTDLTLPFPTITDECSIEYDVHITGDFGDFDNISGDVTIPNVGVGEYEVTYSVTDNCGNTAYETITITVEDCKKPTPLCDNGLVVEIMQTQMVEVWASDFDEGSFDNCGPIAYFSFSPDTTDVSTIYTCDDLGQQPVEVWVTDIYGNQDFCETFIVIQDNMNFCDGVPIVIAGEIATEGTDPVEGVTVEMNGGLLTDITGLDGLYDFSIVAGNDYTVTPMLDENAANGVTTYDMVLITRHILNVQLLDSPYKIIAADANNSGTVSTLDLVAIRKVILVIEENFPNNTSWRFVDKDYLFPNMTNPWADPNGFPEVINYNNLQNSDLEADFVAIKVGDVNGSAATNLLGSAEDRTMMGDLVFHTKDMDLKAGKTYEVPFYGDDQEVSGYQFTMELGEGIELMHIGEGLTSEENFGFAKLNDGALTTSWNEANVRQLGSEEVLFTLVIKAKENTTLSKELSVSSRYTVAEAYPDSYRGDGQLLNVQLSFGNELANGFELYQNIPNPFTGVTRIGFRLPEATTATLTIMDASGRVLRVLDGEFGSGYNEMTVSDFAGATGVLYYQLETPTNTATRKMVILE
ncbi:MAG: T9SS type A sorting domain-containing protein [Saprospirales bacterium]|nr:T9SS type A sorting domain-containing protein [Saprospirales bacterium]